jgi:hypothetical protein
MNMDKDSLATGIILTVFLALVILFARVTIGVLPSIQPDQSFKPIPPISQFTLPARGIPINDAQQVSGISLPSGNGGLWFVNQTGNTVQVVVSDTIATLGVAKGFLFIVPPQTYDLYIYGLSDRPVTKSERVEEGKTRYIYLVPVALR